MTENAITALQLAKSELTHNVPDDCYATGPKTGDVVEDLLRCPGCTALRAIEHALQPESARLVEAAPDLWKALDDLEAALDPQIYPQQKKLDFDAPDDHQYDVTITAKQWRQISAALTKAKQG